MSKNNEVNEKCNLSCRVSGEKYTGLDTRRLLHTNKDLKYRISISSGSIIIHDIIYRVGNPLCYNTINITAYIYNTIIS